MNIHLEDPICATPEAAQAVLDALHGELKRRGSVTVGDLVILMGLPSNWALDRCGWKSLGDAKVIEVEDGWVVSLPKPQILK